MMDREARELARRVARLGRRGRGMQYPRQLRERIAAWVRARRQQGDWWCDLSRAIGVSAETLKRWAADHGTSQIALVPVEVLDAPPAGTVTLVSPTGLRIEGVAVVDAIAILRGLA